MNESHGKNTPLEQFKILSDNGKKKQRKIDTLTYNIPHCLCYLIFTLFKNQRKWLIHHFL